MNHRRTQSLFLVALISLLVPLAHAGPRQAQTKVEKRSLSAQVVSFHTSLGSNGWHYATTTIHFENITQKPLILACENANVSITDDKGNRYGVVSSRGIGMITGPRADAGFVLAPGKGGDAFFESRWRADRNVEFGLTFDIDATVRELEFAGPQLKIGAATVLSFTGLKNGYVGGLLTDQTVNAGPFSSKITRSVVSLSANKRYQTVEMTLEFTNTSDKPLTLGYESTSSYGIDDQGNRFGYGTAGTHDTSMSGMGLITGAGADPQFVLAPGESREARFSIRRNYSATNAGTQVTYFVSLQQLEVLPSKQIRQVRQFSLTFPQISLKK